jgi:Fe2+ transport system protein FeoA
MTALTMTPLSITPPGIARCISINGDGPETIRLKRLGICDGREIEVVQAGDPMIVNVAGARVGLSKQVAHQVLVACTQPLSKVAAGG